MPNWIEVEKFLSRCRHILDKNGQLYILCHPKKSRLGTHLFKYNKAYLHIIKKNLLGKATLEINEPIKQFYFNLIKKCNFEIKKEIIYEEFIEKYFDKYNLNLEHEVQFLEYICY